MFSWKDKTVLLTGGTGSFGKKFTEIMLAEYDIHALRILSRDELKQSEMKMLFPQEARLRFFIGDVRDKERVHRAMDEVDVVIHAAALKQVPSCEYNPFEAVKTNILGAENIINEAIDHNVTKVMAISTDKAVNPVNLYGATKLCAERIFVAANSYVGVHPTRMACVRYGNVVGSRGSVIPLFNQQRHTGIVSVTDERMTRFWISLDQGVRFVIRCIEQMYGGEIFVPKIPSMKVVDLAKIMCPECKIDYVGIRPGEKIHEVLVTEEEARHSREFDRMFIIVPEDINARFYDWTEGQKLPDGFRYTSDNNRQWLSTDELRKLTEMV